MFDSKIGAIAVALLGAVAIVPVAAQQPPSSEGSAMSDKTLNASVPDETVARTGAALKQVAEIKNVYAPKVEAAPTPDERVRLSNQEIDAAKKAIGEQGLTIDQYNDVMKLAQADPALRERLLKAANSGH
jgi:hypothetical protein